LVVVSRSRRADPVAPRLGGRADEAELRALVDSGAVLGRDRPVHHYVICPTRRGARTVILQLREAGFDASMFENPTAQGWIVVAERRELLDHETLQLSRSLLELIADHNGADYDGWRTDLLASEELP
jgi:hypothetical protein